MSRRRHSKAEVTAVLRQVKAGGKVRDVARDIGVSEHTIYGWKAKYGRLEVREAQQLRRLEDENRQLKKLLADLSLDQEMLKALIAKNRPELVERRTDANWLREQYAVSERRVCGLLSMAVSSYRYAARRCDEELRHQLVQLAREKPRFGYRRLHMLLQREGETANHKRVYRVYREAGLCLRRNKRKHRKGGGAPLPQDTAANQEWALDSAHDVLAAGKTIELPSGVDALARECSVSEVDTSCAGRQLDASGAGDREAGVSDLLTAPARVVEVVSARVQNLGPSLLRSERT